MRCSECRAENPGTSSLRAKWGLRFRDLLSRLPLSTLAMVGAISVGVPEAWARDEPSLAQLAAANFPDLRRAERAMLEFAQAGNAHMTGLIRND